MTVDNKIEQQTTAFAPTGEISGTSDEKSPEAKTCNITGGLSGIGECIVTGIIAGMAAIGGSIAYLILIIASFMLWIVGGLFNWVVIRTVFEFGSYFGASEGLLVAWGIMRDLGNIMLLFGFIFMGIATILNTHSMDQFSARRALPHLIIFAVLLNFSLFASQVVIDTANGFASVFTEQAGIKNCSEAATVEQDTCGNVGIAGSVLQMAGIANIWDVVKIREWGNFLQNPTQQAPVYIGLALFVTITAVVLLAGAIMLIIRAVVLMFLMVTSPIGFAGLAIPPLQKIANKWWHTLFSQAFFAPVYLLLILISLKIASGLTGSLLSGGQNGEATLAAALINGGTLGPQVFVLFAIVIGFMIASLIVAKQMGAMGASFATNTAGKFIGGATLGTVGFVGRRTIGRGAIAGATALHGTSFGRSGLGKLVVGGLNKGGKSSFDLRATPLSKAAGAAHIDMGTAQKGGYEKILHDAEENRVKYAKDLRNTKGEKEVIGEIDTQMKAKKRLDQTEIREMEIDQETERIPLKDELDDRRRDVADARARGNQAALMTAELGLNNVTRAYDELRETQARAHKELEGQHERWMAGQEIAKKDFKNAPQTEYGFRLNKKGGAVGAAFGYWATAGPSADHHAAEKILKELNKNDNQKLIDALGGVRERISTPPPAPHP